MNYLQRITKRFFRHLITFSPYYAFLELLVIVDRKLSDLLHKKESTLLLKLKGEYILDWLRSQFNDVIHKYNTFDRTSGLDNGSISDNIWVCWLQGEKAAPFVVRSMIKNIREKSGRRTVHVISMQNYTQYCTIPETVRRKYVLGMMPIQQFADVLRAALLEQRGGLWIDATVLLTKTIPDEVFSLPIYNIKNINPNFNGSVRVLDSTLYQCYFIAAKRHSATYSFISECLNDYWERFDTLIDYFLISYLAKIAREDIFPCFNEYSQIPDNNEMCELLHSFLMKGLSYTDRDFGNFWDSTTLLYKLSWKTPYPMYSPQGEFTLYHKIFNDILNKS